MSRLNQSLSAIELIKGVQVNLKEWHEIIEFKDCPAFNQKVLAFHDDTVYFGVLEKGGQNHYLWRLENSRVIEWVDVFEVDFWLEIA